MLKKILFSLLLAAGLLLPTLFANAQEGSVALSVSAPATAKVGDTVSAVVNVAATGTLDTGGRPAINVITFTMTYDPALLEIQNPPAAASAVWTSILFPANTSGSYKATVTISEETTESTASRSGAVVTVNFKAKATGTAQLDLASTSSAYADGNAVATTVSGGSVVISEADAPVPPAPNEPEIAPTPSTSTGTSETTKTTTKTTTTPSRAATSNLSTGPETLTLAMLSGISASVGLLIFNRKRRR